MVQVLMVKSLCLTDLTCIGGIYPESEISLVTTYFYCRAYDEGAGNQETYTIDVEGTNAFKLYVEDDGDFNQDVYVYVRFRDEEGNVYGDYQFTRQDYEINQESIVIMYMNSAIIGNIYNTSDESVMWTLPIVSIEIDVFNPDASGACSFILEEYK